MQNVTRIAGALFGCLLSSSPQPRAEVISQDLYLATSGQSIWEQGAAGGLNVDKFIGPTWDKKGSLDLLVGDIFGDTKGKVGVDFKLDGTTGTLGVKYPMQVTFDIPDAGTRAVGGTFTIGSSFAPLPDGFTLFKRTGPVVGFFDTGGPQLRTMGPDFSARLDAVAALAAHVGGDVCFIVCSDPVRVGFDTGEQRVNLFSLDRTGGSAFGASFNLNQDVDIIPNILSAHVNLPRLDTKSAGLNGTTLAADDRQNLAGINLNITNLAAQLLGFPPLSGSIGPVSYNLFSAGVGLYADLEQQFTFLPQPRVHLDFTSPVQQWDGTAWGGPTTAVDFLAGDTLTLRAPNVEDLGVLPTITLDNTTSNRTDAILGGELDISALAAGIKGVGGIGPLLHPAPLRLDLDSFNAYSNSFDVNIAPVKADPFNIDFNRFGHVPGAPVVDLCATDPSSPGCDSFGYRTVFPQLTASLCGPELTDCTPSLSLEPFAPKIYKTDGACHQDDPLLCDLHELVGTTSDGTWDESVSRWIFSNDTGFALVGFADPAAPSTDLQGAELVRSLGFDRANFVLRVPGAVPEPTTVPLAMIALAACCAFTRRRT